MSRLAFIDTETTGLDSRTEDVFEVAVINERGSEFVFRLEPRPDVVEAMHPRALEVNRYHERVAEPDWHWDDPHTVLKHLYELLHERHIVGAVPDFDTRFLTALFWRYGQEPPRWHYHLIDVEALALGWLHRDLTEEAAEARDGDSWVRARTELLATLPWESDDLSRACGVVPPGDDERHTALADARWAKRLYEAITGGA